ncbi:hypothetical protein BTUL_0093g00480 [Botrytis tulipae]|uniref:Uncharacterized protein n=1 Tax=Botrytis tulipae TaxID=87230 RepID=A0A4Z1ELY6_9HELO|nr:hypothetical protein BTUL_0093g00480 [Botrytis tulipae]
MSSAQQTQSESSNPSNTGSTRSFAGLPRELDDIIWSQVPTTSGPRLIEIHADPTIQTGEKQFKMEIGFYRNPDRLLLNARAVILSHNRHMFDHKITNPQIVNTAKDTFIFNGISQLDEYVQHTGAIITKTGAVDSQSVCYPTMQNLVVRLSLDIGYPGSEPYLVWLNRLREEIDFDKFILEKILREILESVSKVQSLKKIYLLTEEEKMPGPRLVERIDGRLMDLFAEDDELQSRYGEGLRIPEIILQMTTQIVSQNEGLDPVEIKAELDPKFWSLKSTGTNENYPPQLIEIKKYDFTFEVLANKKPRESSNRRPWIINFEVKSIRKSQKFTNLVNFTPRALHLSPSCFKLDYKIKNPILFRPSCDVLFFREFAHLLEYAVATKGIVTNYTASTPVANETFPKVERVVVKFEVHMPISWSFHDILVELLPVIKEAGTLKGVILLVVRQSLRENGVGFLRIDEDLKKLVDESPDVYPPPVGVHMPRVTCMTMETFESTFGWYGLGQALR